jgi:hypothetical protein
MSTLPMPNSNQLRIAGLILSIFVIASFLYPNHIPPYRSFFNELLAVSGIYIALFYLTYSSNTSIRFSSVLVLPLGLIVIVLLQALNGYMVYSIDCLLPVLTLISLAVAIILGATMVRSPNGMIQLSLVLAWTFIISCLLSLVCMHIQTINLNLTPWVHALPETGFHRPSGNIGQPNQMALLFCFSVAAAWYLYLMGQLKSGLAIVLVLLMLWGAALTQSRVAWLILPMFAILCWSQPQNVRDLNRYRYVIPGLLFIFVLMVLFVPIFSAFWGMPMDTLAHRAGQNSIRLVLWHQAWSFSLLHPWLGGGWHQFGAEQVRYAQFFPPAEYADNAHNIVLNFADEIGWPFTIAAAAFFIYWFYQSSIKRWSNAQVRFLSLIIIAALIHSMVEFPLWYGIFSVPFALILGALHAEHAGVKDYSLHRSVVPFAASVYLIVTIFLSADVIHVSRAFDSVEKESGSLQDATQAIERSRFTISSQYYDYLTVRELKIGPQNARQVLPLFEKQAVRFGFPPVLESLAFLYAWDNRPKDAAIMLIKIQKLFDSSSDSYLDMYHDWGELSEKDSTGYFSAIFKMLPKPISLNVKIAR